MTWLSMWRRVFNRRAGVALLWAMLVVGAAILINAIGIHIVGDMENWRDWLGQHTGYFFVWRLCVYGATGYGWLWMRKRVHQRESSPELRQRLLRSEIAAVLAIVVLEASVLVQGI